MSKKIIFLVVIAAIIVAGIISWVSLKKRPQQIIEVPKIIKIGAVYPFTGASASSGASIKEGVEMAVEIINNYYEVEMPFAKTKGLSSFEGAEIEIVFVDHKEDPNIAAQEVERLVKEEGVIAIIGCYQSAITAKASEKAEELQIPFLNAESTNPDLTKRGFKWFFRTTPDDDMFAENFFAFMNDLSVKGYKIPKRIALVYEKGLFGTGVARAEEKYALRNGFEIVADVPYDSKTEDFSEEVKKISASKAEIVMQASYDDDSILSIKSYKDVDYSPAAILGMDAGFISPKFMTTLGRDAEYIFSREVWAIGLGEKRPLIKQINQLFRGKYNKDLNGTIARAFTGVFVLADAINRAGATEPGKIRKALSETMLSENQIIMPWKGVEFDGSNQNKLGNGIIVQVQDGVYRTVWPFELAMTETIWPVPAWDKRQ